MQTTTSSDRGKQFASSPLEATTSPRYTVRTELFDGVCTHEFVHLGSAAETARRLLALGFDSVTIERCVEECEDSRNPL